VIFTVIFTAIPTLVLILMLTLARVRSLTVREVS